MPVIVPAMRARRQGVAKVFEQMFRLDGKTAVVTGAGSGFGGRSYLLRREPAPEGSDLQVTVRLDDEAGAAAARARDDERLFV